MQWTLAIEPTGTGPMFLRIAHAISEDIQRGRLRGGETLPSTRALASMLGVHRNTVVAAYRELTAEGWIGAEPARGTFVSAEIPTSALPKKRGIAATAGFALRAPEPIGRAASKIIETPFGRGRTVSRTALMTFGGGIADIRLLPTASLARAMRRALRQKPLEVLSYGPPAGPLAMRRAIASMVAATRGIAAEPENVLVARGAQMGIDLAARTLAGPGDVIAVEELGFRPAWAALASSGARLVPLPVDEHGMDVAALEELSTRERLRGVYVTPQHQYPTTVTLAAGRRLRLLELARTRGFWVLEDDYDHEFHFEGQPPLPLANADRHGVVVYVGTFSKVLAPGMRLGFVVAPAPVIERLAVTRRFVDRQGDHLLATAVAELIEDGEIQRHIRRTKRICAERRLRLMDALTSTFGDRLSFTPAPGGTALWVRVSRKIDVDAWAERAMRDAALVLSPGSQFSFDRRPRPFLRLGFAQHDAAELREAVRRLAQTIPD